MALRVFLAYPSRFREHKKSGTICDFLDRKGCIVDRPDPNNYSGAESTIEPTILCDTFITLLGPIAKGNPRLSEFRDYALALHRIRWHPRLRIFGLWLGLPDKDVWFKDWHSSEYLDGN